MFYYLKLCKVTTRLVHILPAADSFASRPKASKSANKGRRLTFLECSEFSSHEKSPKWEGVVSHHREVRSTFPVSARSSGTVQQLKCVQTAFSASFPACAFPRQRVSAQPHQNHVSAVSAFCAVSRVSWTVAHYREAVALLFLFSFCFLLL